MVYWPEFRSCFGLCSLKSGVYVIASIGTLLNALSVIGNVLVYLDLMLKRRELFNNGREHWNMHLPDARQTLLYWLKILQGYLIAWIIIKTIIFLTNLLLFYGIRKSKNKIIKIYLYINFQGWILTVINAAIIAHFFNIVFKFFVVVYVFLDGYKLLVVRSTYRQMTGKQRFLDDNSTNSIPRGLDDPPRYTCPTSTPHCATCTCVSTESVHEPEDKEINILTPTTESPEVVDDLKDSPVIFDHNQLRIQEDIVQRDENTTPSTEVKDTKDIVVIFDENQLNVGPSPIYEERPFSTEVTNNLAEPCNSKQGLDNKDLKIEVEEENFDKESNKAIRPTTLNIRSRNYINDQNVSIN